VQGKRLGAYRDACIYVVNAFSAAVYFGGPQTSHAQLHASSKSEALPASEGSPALAGPNSREIVLLTLEFTGRSLGDGALADFVKSANFVNEAMFRCAHIPACDFRNPKLREG
jgi:hypothetical protein